MSDVSLLSVETLEHASGVYALTNVLTGEQYIGSAVDLRRRLQTHRRQLQSGRHFNDKLLAAVREHGLHVLRVDVLEAVEDAACLVQREQHYIDTLKPAYNNFPKARNNLGMRHSETARERMRAVQQQPQVKAAKSEVTRKLWSDGAYRDQMTHKAQAQWQDPTFREHRTEEARQRWEDPAYREMHAQKAKTQFVGKAKSPEHRAKIAAALRGRKVSAEARAKMSESQRRRRPPTPETRAKISAAGTGRQQSPETRAKRSATMKALRQKSTEVAG